jgi:hypothetical protein
VRKIFGNRFLLYIEKCFEKYNFSERFSPLPRKENRVCYKIVDVSEIILKRSGSYSGLSLSTYVEKLN